MNAPDSKSLVKVSIMEDPLSPPERYFLSLTKLADGYEYTENSSVSSDATKLAKSAEPLNVAQLAALLNRRHWFDCDVTLQSLEDSQLASPDEWVCGGKFPLLSCVSPHAEIPEHFQNWVKSQCQRILESRNT
jgi:hypothetical protein